MDYNERIFLNLSAGNSVVVSAEDKEPVARAVRRRLQNQHGALKALGMTTAKKTLHVTAQKDGSYILTLTERKTPAFTILQEPSNGDHGETGS